MERLSSQDAAFLHLEDEVNHMHIGSVAVFEGPPPEPALLQEMLRAHLVGVPRYRQRVHFLPLALGRPVWVDDPHFNLDYHVRRTALPEPGGDQELRNLVGRVMSQALDRQRPLWETWVIEGLGDGRWAMLSKVHHCMVDGVASAELLSKMLDSERHPDVPRPPHWHAERQPPGAELAIRALADRATGSVSTVRGVLGSPQRTVEAARETAHGLLTMAGVLQPPPRSSLNGPIGPNRRWDWAGAELGDVKRVRARLGGTVNDVVLTAIAGGFRELLASRGESTDRPVRTLVPVSVRSADERDAYNNRVSAIFADLPVGIADPVARLAAVREQMDHLKHSDEAVAGDVLVNLSGFAPAMLLAVALRTAAQVPQRTVQTVTTNVPGPQRPLYAAARRMLECFPYVPLAGHVRVGVAIFSYDGRLGFGVTGDYDQAPDIGVLCGGIERSIAELVEVAERAGPREAA
jgi:diacylglycerol O-acyltransferase / wax synthase